MDNVFEDLDIIITNHLTQKVCGKGKITLFGII